MGVKIKLSVLVDPTFVAAFKKLCEQKITMKEHYRLAKAGRMIAKEGEDFQAARSAFYKANGTEHVDDKTKKPTGSYSLSTEMMNKFTEEFTEIVSREVELPLPAPVVLPADCTMTALEMMPLLDLIVEQAETTTQPLDTPSEA